MAAVVLPPNVSSHKLTGLKSHSRYEVHGMASTREGSVNGSSFQFYTKAYGMYFDRTCILESYVIHELHCNVKFRFDKSVFRVL